MAASDRRSLATAFLLLLALAAAAPAIASSPASAPAALAAGEHGSYSWMAKATRSAPPACLSVAITHRQGRFNYDRSRFRDCASGLRRAAAPLVVGGTHLGHAGEPKMTVFAILAAPGTRAIRLTVSDGLRAANLRASLEPILARPSRAANLSFAVVALPGTHCLERLATRDAAGELLWRGTLAEHACGDPGPEAALSTSLPATSQPAAQ